MVVPSLMQIGQFADFAGATADVDQRAIAFIDGAVFGSRRNNGLARSLQTRFDLAQHGEDVGSIGFLHQNGLAFLYCVGMRTGVEVGFGQFAGDAQGLVVPADLLVSFLQNLQ